MTRHRPRRGTQAMRRAQLTTRKGQEFFVVMRQWAELSLAFSGATAAFRKQLDDELQGL